MSYTYTQQIVAGNDGCWLYPTYFNPTAAALVLGKSTGVANKGGFVWFSNITAPPGHTLVSAKLTVVPYSGNNSSHVTIVAEKAPQPLILQNQNDPATRALTTNSVVWTTTGWVNGTPIDSPDISAIITELIGQSGWIPGNNAVQFFLTADDTISIYGAYGSLANAVILTLVWSNVTLSDGPTTFAVGANYTEAAGFNRALSYSFATAAAYANGIGKAWSVLLTLASAAAFTGQLGQFKGVAALLLVAVRDTELLVKVPPVAMASLATSAAFVDALNNRAKLLATLTAGSAFQVAFKNFVKAAVALATGATVSDTATRVSITSTQLSGGANASPSNVPVVRIAQTLSGGVRLTDAAAVTNKLSATLATAAQIQTAFVNRLSTLLALLMGAGVSPNAGTKPGTSTTFGSGAAIAETLKSLPKLPIGLGATAAFAESFKSTMAVAETFGTAATFANRKTKTLATSSTFATASLMQQQVRLTNITVAQALAAAVSLVESPAIRKAISEILGVSAGVGVNLNRQFAVLLVQLAAGSTLNDRLIQKVTAGLTLSAGALLTALEDTMRYSGAQVANEQFTFSLGVSETFVTEPQE